MRNHARPTFSHCVDSLTPGTVSSLLMGCTSLHRPLVPVDHTTTRAVHTGRMSAVLPSSSPAPAGDARRPDDEPPQPVEETAELYRFQTKVAAGKNTSFTVTEEKDFGTAIQITNSQDDQIRHFINLNEASPALSLVK